MELSELIPRLTTLLRWSDAAAIHDNNEEAYDHLGKMYDLLYNEVGSGAKDKCESAESSAGS